VAIVIRIGQTGEAALIGFMTAGAYLALAPAVVNGDGLGYLKAATGGGLYPGHLTYVPLLRLAARLLAAGPRPVDALWAGRLVSAAGAWLAVGSTGTAAARLCGARAGRVAALGLAASFGMVAAGSDVESYAPALGAIGVFVYALARRRDGGAGWSALAALAIVTATLLHVENLLLLGPAVVASPGRERPWIVALVGVVVGGWYASVAPALGWLAGSSHGFHYPITPLSPAVALYGAAKALVYSPYPYEASWARVLGQFLVGAVALLALARLARRGGAPLGPGATWAWAIPYAAVGMAFFASDAERWVFLLPLGWLSVAAAGRPGRALAVAGLLAVANLVLWLPVARDDGFRARARLASRHLRAGDLVICPGHGWDEYLGFYEGPPVEIFPLVYYAGALGGRAPLAQALAAARARAERRGARALAVRLDDRRDPLGWKELRPFGVTPVTVGELVPGRRVPLGDGVAEIEP
jgi:hypothetical protein